MKKSTTILILMFGFAGAFSATAGEIYMWTDENGNAQYVRGHHVARELYAAEIAVDRTGQALCKGRLSYTGDIVNKNVPARKQANHA